MRITKVFLIVSLVVNSNALLAQTEEKKIVVEPSERGNWSPSSVQFSAGGERRDLNSPSRLFGNLAGLVRFDADLEFPGRDVHLEIKGDQRVYRVPRYSDTGAKVLRDIHLVLVWVKHCENDDDETVITIDELRECLNRKNKNFDEEMARTHKLFSWKDIQGSAYRLVIEAMMNRAMNSSTLYRHRGSNHFEREITVGGFASPRIQSETHEYIIPIRGDELTIADVVRLRNELVWLIDALKQQRESLQTDSKRIQFPFGESVSAEAALARREELQQNINYANDGITRNKPRWVGSKESHYIPGNPDLVRRYERQKKAAEAELERYEHHEMFEQLIALGTRRRILSSLALLNEILADLELERDDLTRALDLEFEGIRSRALGTLEEYRQKFQAEVDAADLGFKQARFFEPGEVTKSSTEQLVGSLSAILEELDALQANKDRVSEMKLKRVVSLVQGSGIVEQGLAIRSNTRVPGERDSDYNQGLARDVGDVIFARNFLLDDGSEKPIAYMAFSNDQRKQLFELWLESGRFGGLTQSYVGIVLLSHSFWEPSIVSDLERLSSDIVSTDEIDALVMGAFESLAYWDQWRAAKDLEAANSRYAARARSRLETRLSYQPAVILGHELGVDQTGSRFSDSVFMFEIKQVEDAFASGDIAKANRLFKEVLSKVSRFDHWMGLIARFKQEARLSDESWFLLFETIEAHFAESWDVAVSLWELQDLESEELERALDENPDIALLFVRSEMVESILPSESAITNELKAQLDDIEAEIEVLGHYYSILSRQSLILRSDLAGRARLLAKLALSRLNIDGNRWEALSYLLSLGARLETESDLAGLYLAYDPVFESILGVGISRRLAYLEIKLSLSQNESDEAALELVERDNQESESILNRLRVYVIQGEIAATEQYDELLKRIDLIIQSMKTELENAERMIR